MENYLSYENYLKYADTNKIKLDFIVWYSRLKYLLLISFFGGGAVIIQGIISKNIGLGIIGFLFFIVSIIFAIIYAKIDYSDKDSLSLALLMVANSIELYQKNTGELKNSIKKKMLFYLRYINGYFEEQTGTEFFDKNEYLFEKINSLAKRINFALLNSKINKYDTSEIKKFAWELYTENEKVYRDIDKISNVIIKEVPFKSLSDHIKKFFENKYVKIGFFEILIIVVVIASHLIFPTYVEKDKVFWAIIILTVANFTINFAKK